MRKKAKQLSIHTFPLMLGILLSYLFWGSNPLLLAIYIVAVFLVIAGGKDRQVELQIFIYGMVVGFVIETIGTQISGYQRFTNPDIWGIPYWLIVSWGYGFILMKRIGFIFATGSPWIQK